MLQIYSLMHQNLNPYKRRTQKEMFKIRLPKDIYQNHFIRTWETKVLHGKWKDFIKVRRSNNKIENRHSSPNKVIDKSKAQMSKMHGTMDERSIPSKPTP